MNEATCFSARRGHPPETFLLTGERINAAAHVSFHHVATYAAVDVAAAGPAPVARGRNLQSPLTLSKHNIFSMQRQGLAMATRAAKSTATEEIAAIEELMSDLEKRLHRLSSNARGEVAGASGDVRDFVSESLNNIMSRVRDSAATMTQSVADETTRVGTDAFNRAVEEVEHRPLLMLGLAAGIGFLAGLASRRH